MFKELELSKLQQLRKVFSLLDLRNKEYVFLSEVQNIIKKYKFIKLSTDQLIEFLSIISDDLESFKKEGKMSINFELYSRAISAIEQQLLKQNSDYFTEKNNDSYEIVENAEQMIEDLENIESESIDYIMVLADKTKSLEYLVTDNIIDSAKKLSQDDTYLDVSKDILLENINQGSDIVKEKISDVEYFLKELNTNSLKKQNKINYLKKVVENSQTTYKHLEQEYRNFYERNYMTQPLEINEETEKLLDENNYLEGKIRELTQENKEREKEKFNYEQDIADLKFKIEEINRNVKNEKNAHDTSKLKYAELQKSYDKLMDEIYEKIKIEEAREGVNLNEVEKQKNNENLITSASTLNKIKQISSNSNILSMDYEKLVLYTLKLEKTIQSNEESFNNYESKIKALENEIKDLNDRKNKDNDQVRILKSENAHLNKKVNELTKDIELNLVYRPSNALHNRLSRMSERKSALTNNLRFKVNDKLFEEKPTTKEIVDYSQKDIINEVSLENSLNIARLSNLNNDQETNVINRSYNKVKSPNCLNNLNNSLLHTSPVLLSFNMNNESTNKLNETSKFIITNNNDTLNQTQLFLQKDSIVQDNSLFEKRPNRIVFEPSVLTENNKTAFDPSVYSDPNKTESYESTNILGRISINEDYNTIPVSGSLMQKENIDEFDDYYNPSSLRNTIKVYANDEGKDDIDKNKDSNIIKFDEEEANNDEANNKDFNPENRKNSFETNTSVNLNLISCNNPHTQNLKDIMEKRDQMKKKYSLQKTKSDSNIKTSLDNIKLKTGNI